MQRFIGMILAIALWMTGMTGALAQPVLGTIVAPQAGYDLAHQSMTTVRVSLGNEANELKFFPDTLTFQSGKRYQLILTNNSPTKHYFTAKDFADGIWSQKVDTGKVEIKGAIHELEVRPNGEAEWVFVAVRPGQYSLRCVVPGHTEAGMVGQITVAAK